MLRRRTRLPVICDLLLVCAAAFWNITHAQADSIDISSDDINSYLEGRASPLAGTGPIFFTSGRTHSVDPRLMLGIANAETTLGKFGTCSEYNNPFNWFKCAPEGTCSYDQDASVKCPLSAYDSWDDAISEVTRKIRHFYLMMGRTTIPLIGSKYCAEGCGDWVDNVRAEVYTKLGGDERDLGFNCGDGVASSYDPVRFDVEECDPGSPILGTTPDDEKCRGRCRTNCTCAPAPSGSGCVEKPISFGETKGGRLGPDDCPAFQQPGHTVDRYTITVAEDTYLALDVASTDFDTEVHLREGQASRGYNDNCSGSSGTDSCIYDFWTERQGERTFYIEVGSVQAGASGDYTVRLRMGPICRYEAIPPSVSFEPVSTRGACSFADVTIRSRTDEGVTGCPQMSANARVEPQNDPFEIVDGAPFGSLSVPAGGNRTVTLCCRKEFDGTSSGSPPGSYSGHLEVEDSGDVIPTPRGSIFVPLSCTIQ